jgi:UDP-3-O-[3-hydroxymyristoyl] glucosamine N-acyltransferase
MTVVRDGEFETIGIANHDTPRRLVFLEHERWLESIVSQTEITCVITTPALASQCPRGVATSDEPRRTFFELHNRLARETSFYWTDFPTFIDPSARIHPRAYVAERNVRIGANVFIEPDVTILERVILGDGCIIRAGSRIGTQGFEFKHLGDEILPVEHAGGVRLGERVEVQANCTIDRSVFGGFTELGDDTKLDNMVHIAHHVKSGRRCLFAACAMVAGSVTFGDDVWIGPAAAISSGVKIGDRASITIGAVITRDVAPDARMSGNFAVEHEKLLAFLRTIR